MRALLVIGEASAKAGGDWWSEHATLVVGVVGIVVSGLLGPSVAAWLTARRERDKDKRAAAIAWRDDLRELLDSAAIHVGGAVTAVRPALAAQRDGEPIPDDVRDFLATLFPLGQRLRLRLADDHPAVQSYDKVREQLVAITTATDSQASFNEAVREFEARRTAFLDQGRLALEAPISQKEVR